MCGILGLIGDSKVPEISFALTNSLLKITESRGKESTGFWCTQGGDDGEIMYHKAPMPSSKFIDLEIWKMVKEFNPNLLIAHCREPSTGVGSPNINSNNHPHVSLSYMTALVHNGRVFNYEVLKSSGYAKTLGSECDSEILLRMFERGEYFDNTQQNQLKERFKGTDPDVSHRLYGLEQIFLNAPNAHMAVAIAERKMQQHRMLWLWHNARRPLWILDLRSSLGQFFFCSTPEIWRNAIEDNQEVMNFLPKDHEMIELSVDKIFLIDFDPTKESDLQNKTGWSNGWRTRRYDLEPYEEDDNGGEEFSPSLTANNPPEAKIAVWTMLDEKEKILTNIQKIYTDRNFINDNDDNLDLENSDTDLENTQVKFEKKESSHPLRPEDDEDIIEASELKEQIEKCIKDITETVEQIDINISNSFLEGSANYISLRALLKGLELAKSQIEETALLYSEK